MGNVLTNWVQTQTVGAGGPKSVLLCLADKAYDSERGKVEMTIPQIAAIIEFDKRSVMRWLDALEKENGEGKAFIVRKKSKKSDGTNNPNVYQILCPPEIFAEKPSDTQSPSQEIVVTESHLDGDSQSLSQEKTGENAPENNQGDTQSLPKMTESHQAQGDTESPSTVLREEELLIDNLINPNLNTSHAPRAREDSQNFSKSGWSYPDYEKRLFEIVKEIQGVETLRNLEEHRKGAAYLFQNKASPANVKACYLDVKSWKKAKITLETIADEYGDFMSKQNAANAAGGNENGNGNGNGNKTNGKPTPKRVNLSRFSSPKS